jgi:arabinose-5-phosphate isomerase
MGKSGHIARKIAATLASTGTPSLFVHPGEASHGDLGMITADDCVLALSNSGETRELGDLIEHCRRFKVPLIGITSRGESTLARQSDVALVMPAAEEACPNGLAPTTSTTMSLVLGDALAVALMKRRGFEASDFRVFHPGGKLGARLKYVRDLMHRGDELPLTAPETSMSDAILTMTEKRFGCVGVLENGTLTGIVTDGDLRRHMGGALLTRTVGDVMTRAPKTVTPDTLVAEALEVMNSLKITALFAVEDGRPVGILHIHDALRAGVA